MSTGTTPPLPLSQATCSWDLQEFLEGLVSCHQLGVDWEG